jgi:hypothetical protein
MAIRRALLAALALAATALDFVPQFQFLPLYPRGRLPR